MKGAHGVMAVTCAQACAPSCPPGPVFCFPRSAAFPHTVTWFSRALPHQTLKNQGVSRLGSAAVNNDHVGWALPPLPFCGPTNRSQGPGCSATPSSCEPVLPRKGDPSSHHSTRAPASAPRAGGDCSANAKAQVCAPTSFIVEHVPVLTSAAPEPLRTQGEGGGSLRIALPCRLRLKDVSGHGCCKGPTPSARAGSRLHLRRGHVSWGTSRRP